MKKSIAGSLRPSQAVTQFGPGALIDLPTLSMVVAATDEWSMATSMWVDEPRLAKELEVKGFRRPPYLKISEGLGGIPAHVFPRVLRCPSCHRIGDYSLFRYDDSRADPRFVCEEPHKGLTFPPTVFPSRFMVACTNGHLDDFPWSAYVHQSSIDCDDNLSLEDTGETGSLSDLLAHCKVHNAWRSIGPVMGKNGPELLGSCSRSRPWIGDHDTEDCIAPVRVLLRGASNAYFPVIGSAISVPPWSDPVQVTVAELGAAISGVANVDSLEKLGLLFDVLNEPERKNGYSTEELWEALERRRQGSLSTVDIRVEEWHSFRSYQHHLDPKSEFQVRQVAVPASLTPYVAKLAQVVRLREVRALRGFTRIDPIPDIGDMEEVGAIDAGMSKVSLDEKDWLPGIDQRGEGIFIELNQSAVKDWESRDSITRLGDQHAQAQRDWYKSRGGAQDIEPKPPRFLLLHSLSHLVVRQLGLECGYASASLRERIYCDVGSEDMAGFLIYTASPDSQGSLGGLVEMGKPENFERLMTNALRDSTICGSDPLCADRAPSATGTQLNGAACHACLLESETSCEVGNNYLERALIAGTIRTNESAFFQI